MIDATTLMLKRLMSDIDRQPLWRTEAVMAESYYEGRQLKPDIKEEMEKRGQPVIINNLIAPTINGVLGLERRIRTKPIVKGDDSQGELVNEYLNERLLEEWRLTNADRFVSQAFGSQSKVGLGFIEVTRNDDLFGNKYMVRNEDWADIYYDWNSTANDLSDCRWMMKRSWKDKDVAIAMFPQHAALINASINGWNTVLPTLDDHADSHLLASHALHYGNVLNEEAWLNTERGRICFYDVFYRVPTRATAIEIQGHRELFNPNAKAHRAALAHGMARLVDGIYPAMKRAVFLGPHKVFDGPSPYPHNMFPWVRFLGFIEQRSKVPYGLIRGMLGAQDEVNFRRSMLTWLLKSRRIVMDEDATTMSDYELIRAVSRVDGVIKLNPHRKATARFDIQNEVNIAAQQFSVMENAEKQIQQNAGVYNAFLGRDSSATSGIAINALVEQGQTTLAELYDNYKQARADVATLLLHMIVQDEQQVQKQVAVYASNHNRPTEHMVINEVMPDGQVNNSVSMLNRKVVLDDIASSAGMRQQQLEQLMNFAAQLPDAAKVVMIPYIIQLSEIPHRKELEKDISKALGIGQQGELSPEQQDAQAEEQEMLRQQMALRMATEHAALREKEANALRAEAMANQATANAQLLQVKAQTEAEQPALVRAKAEEVMQAIMQADDTHALRQDHERAKITNLLDGLLQKLA